MPALESARSDLNTGLRDAHSGAGFHHNAARSALVISEMSLALLLLIGAACSFAVSSISRQSTQALTLETY